MVAAEQAAPEDWRRPVAWSITHPPDPPSHLMPRDAQLTGVWPVARLADPSWMAMAVALARDIAILWESRPGGGRQAVPNKRIGNGKDARGEEQQELGPLGLPLIPIFLIRTSALWLPVPLAPRFRKS